MLAFEAAQVQQHQPGDHPAGGEPPPRKRIEPEPNPAYDPPNHQRRPGERNEQSRIDVKEWIFLASHLSFEAAEMVHDLIGQNPWILRVSRRKPTQGAECE